MLNTFLMLSGDSVQSTLERPCPPPHKKKPIAWGDASMSKLLVMQEERCEFLIPRMYI